MAPRYGGLAIFSGVEPTTVNSIANDQVKKAAREVPVKLLQPSYHVLFRAKSPNG
jgi:hypothetical protein